MADKTKDESAREFTLETKSSGDISFTITDQDYINFTNRTTPNEKYEPMHNFLIDTVNEKDKEVLKGLIKSSPATVSLFAGELISAYMPDLGVKAKKHKSAASK
ncbi:MAG: putative phage tail assembly chaperone [Cellvibrionaceae bacterium]